MPVLHYYIGLKSGINATEDVLDCSKMVRLHCVVLYRLLSEFNEILVNCSLSKWVQDLVYKAKQ